MMDVVKEQLDAAKTAPPKKTATLKRTATPKQLTPKQRADQHAALALTIAQQAVKSMAGITPKDIKEEALICPESLYTLLMQKVVVNDDWRDSEYTCKSAMNLVLKLCSL